MIRVPLVAALSGALFMAPLARSMPVSRVSTEIAGGLFVHEVQAGETLTSVAARYSMAAAVLARATSIGNTSATSCGGAKAWPSTSAR